MSNNQSNELGYNYINPDYTLATERTSLRGNCKPATTTPPPNQN